jgi:hypothetical protein
LTDGMRALFVERFGFLRNRTQPRTLQLRLKILSAEYRSGVA